MNNVKFLFLSIFAIVFFTNCEKIQNSAVPSTPTFLPKLTMHGPSSITLSCDETAYTDEGLTAEEQGAEINVETSVEGKYFGGSEVQGSDVYSIVYSAVNQDGIPGADERTVVWLECNGDFQNSIAGMYTADVARNGSLSAQYQGLGPIMVKDLGNNTYQVSDAIGGYYDHGRGYGFHYASLGMKVTANDIAGNDFSIENPVGVGSFGGDNVINNFKVDPATKTITFDADWDYNGDGVVDFAFGVTLTQNQ